ncbi:MAG: homoserine kinase [Chloroflexi bacterium]|nr:homoserine kinase [Chloroflexota bacterium]
MLDAESYTSWVMAVYTQLSANDIQEIVGAYGLTAVRYEPIETGASNSNYLLYTLHGRYILTLFDELNQAGVNKLGELLLLLAANKFPTTRLLGPIKGGTNIIYNGKPVMIKRYIPGQIRRNFNEHMLRQAGAALAQLHQIPAPDFLSGKVPYGVEPFSQVRDQDIDREYAYWLVERFPDLEQQIQQDLPRGFIHGDLFYDNILFVGQQLNGLLDFECALHHYKVFDLAMGIVGLCGDLRGSLGQARPLLDGYQQIRQLEEKEKEALQLFIEYAAVTVSCWRFWKYHIELSIPKKAGVHWQMVNIAKEVRDVPPVQFLEIMFGVC